MEIKGYILNEQAIQVSNVKIELHNAVDVGKLSTDTPLKAITSFDGTYIMVIPDGFEGFVYVPTQVTIDNVGVSANYAVIQPSGGNKYNVVVKTMQFDRWDTNKDGVIDLAEANTRIGVLESRVAKLEASDQQTKTKFRMLIDVLLPMILRNK